MHKVEWEGKGDLEHTLTFTLLDDGETVREEYVKKIAGKVLYGRRRHYPIDSDEGRDRLAAAQVHPDTLRDHQEVT